MKLIHFLFYSLHNILKISFCAADISVACEILRLSEVMNFDPYCDDKGYDMIGVLDIRIDFSEFDH